MIVLGFNVSSLQIASVACCFIYQWFILIFVDMTTS